MNGSFYVWSVKMSAIYVGNDSFAIRSAIYVGNDSFAIRSVANNIEFRGKKGDGEKKSNQWNVPYSISNYISNQATTLPASTFNSVPVR